eukprot:TRINITY_DN2624_c0_g1_i1.p1 TRINITY_DN2624_c0_g1~~TRINITY_DN2624_c0_g1_i1.p1  ORF type:complete len:331 (+),score=112.03 TRINITY_DN2624_c0_g1_i1:86-1078(+)
MCDVVRLNVGGTPFDTTAATLSGASYFETLLSSNVPVDKDAEGRCFVDRDPALFAGVLKYLRTGVWTEPRGSTGEELLREAQYYGVEIVACDFTVGFLREGKAAAAGMEGKVEQMQRAAALIGDKLRVLTADAKDLMFAVVPSFTALQGTVSKVLLKTSRDTLESIDVDKLQVSSMSEEGVPLWPEDELHNLLTDVRLDTLVWYIREHLHFSLQAEKGAMCFPYSTTVRSAMGEPSGAAPHAPVYSKLHGMLLTFRVPPDSRFDADAQFMEDPTPRGRFANVFQRYFPVSEAFFFVWLDDMSRLPDQAHSDPTPDPSAPFPGGHQAHYNT